MSIAIPITRSIRTALVLAVALIGTSLSALAQPAPEPGSAAAALSRANAAFAGNRIVSPAGDNALEWTLTARDVDPKSVRVREGLNDLYPLVVAAIEVSIREGRAADAARVIDLLDRAMPGSLAARELRAKLSRRASVRSSQSVRVAAVDRPL